MDHIHDHDHDHVNDHSHDHDHDHSHDHDHDHSHDGHGHTHDHDGGIINTIGAILHLPGFGHSHDHGYQAQVAELSKQDNDLGIRTVWLALLVLGITTVLQIIIYVASGSVALLADTVHNLGDALNSVPLIIALYLARRVATRRYTYGFGRAEDIAGILIVISIAFSAGYILWESFQKLINPQPLTNIGWVAAAAIVGFIGNELVAVMQIRVGKQIGSDAMIVDGQHARIDGLTSLAVLGAVFGSLIGLPILDPLIGFLIGFAIVGITWNSIKSVWFRLMDAIDPEITHRMYHAIEAVNGVKAIGDIRAHWVGHRVYTEITIDVDPAQSVTEAHQIAENVRQELHRQFPHLEKATIEYRPHGVSHSASHSAPPNEAHSAPHSTPH